VDAVAIEEMGQRLVATLETFRVGAQIIHKTVGPVVTRFELEPGRGVKVGRVSALADDLALAMRASRCGSWRRFRGKPRSASRSRIRRRAWCTSGS